jgi:hypothetical protein
MTEQQWSFFKDFLGGFWEVQFVQNQITSAAQDRFRLWLEEPEAEDCAERLFAQRVVVVPEQKVRLRLKSLREADGKTFNHIEVVFLGKKRRRRRRCFVGHRFLPNVERTLRWNLRHVLEPYNVELDWSGGDIRSVQILDDIVRRIRAADFCIFDTRETEGKPNVYIEAGICYAIRKPFILFGHRLSAGAIPSDLGFALALEYDSYSQLFREFYYRLPLFFRNNVR